MTEYFLHLRPRRLAELWPLPFLCLGIALSLGWAALLGWVLVLFIDGLL